MSEHNHSFIQVQTVHKLTARVTFFLASLLALIYLLMPHWSLALFLGFDFYLRAFQKESYSPLLYISSLITNGLLKWSPKVDERPVAFSALIGFALCDILFIVSLIGLQDAIRVVGMLLAIFALCEALFGLLIGFYSYLFFRKFFKSNKVQGRQIL